MGGTGGGSVGGWLIGVPLQWMGTRRCSQSAAGEAPDIEF